MKFISGAYWDAGPLSVNEDSLLLNVVKTASGRVVFAAVADGVGSLSEGEVASGYILESLNNVFYTQLIPLIEKRKGTKRIIRCLHRSLYEINDDFNKYCAFSGSKLGSTLTFILIFSGKYICFHLGDSGAFLFRKGESKSLCRKHSVKNGSISRLLGSFAFFEPDIYKGYLHAGMGILLATDGFYTKIHDMDYMFNPDDIRCEEQIEKRLYEVGMQIKKKGQDDNASALYIKCCR